MAEIRQRIVFHGRVQGVGFRYTAKYLAQSLGLTGWVENEFDGTVIMEIQGREPMIHKLQEGLNRNSFNGSTRKIYRWNRRVVFMYGDGCSSE